MRGAIAGLDADVVGLQEVRLFQERGLARRLPGYAGAGAGRDDGRGRGERCTVVYRAVAPAPRELDGALVLGHAVAPGSRSWGNPIPRIVTLCRFADRRTGRGFGVANAHWDGASAASRLRSAEALLGWLDPALPWLVLGDLNATAGDPAVARLLAGGLRDTLAHLGERGPQAATHHAWDGVHRRHAHRLRPRRPPLGRPRRAHRPRRGPADACRPTTGRWSPTSRCGRPADRPGARGRRRRPATPAAVDSRPWTP